MISITPKLTPLLLWARIVAPWDISKQTEEPGLDLSLHFVNVEKDGSMTELEFWKPTLPQNTETTPSFLSPRPVSNAGV